jgi:ATP/maltotriose-dependent transcriptional regulator MalT
VVILQPLRQKYDAWLRRFSNRDLSNREQEVVRLGLQGLINSQITQKLGISRATLKTHLNNVYKKIPEIRHENWRFLKN